MATEDGSDEQALETPEAEDAVAPEEAVPASTPSPATDRDRPGVTALEPGMCGRWLVTTQGTSHVWDLDAMTYTRMPGPESHAGAMTHDGTAHRISRVSLWPRVGRVSLVWFDDPDQPATHEQWRKSSRIESIEPIRDLPEPEAG